MVFVVYGPYVYLRATDGTQERFLGPTLASGVLLVGTRHSPLRNGKPKTIEEHRDDEKMTAANDKRGQRLVFKHHGEKLFAIMIRQIYGGVILKPLIEKWPDVRVHTRITIGKDHKEAKAKGFDGDREGRNRPIASRFWCTKAGVGKHLDPKVYLSS